MRNRAPGPAAVTVALLLTLSGCGSSDDTSADDGVSVVASTDVYGDIAATIGGDAVTVTSLLDDPSADPHSFEAGARTELAVSRADVVVENGGGYDDFMDTLLDATDSDATVINAVEVSGKEATAGAGLNEHVWYDLPTVAAVARRIAAALGDADPASADTYTANAAAFTGQLDELTAAVQSARPGTEGAGVVVPEPVPGYLLDALGADDRTPAEFAEAVEEGGDVSPTVLLETLDLVTGGQVVALVHNEQTTGPQTEQVLEAARKAGVAVVGVTETLPEGQHYVPWMRATLDAVVAALGS